ncbi:MULTISPECIES: tripartite tricarboxylate transporter TctB family protein [Paracoccus]|uniref:tripartite tricarboxylate transporter TctB family protein n=1 Tax=Paracoccus TaxID=265 RepID=UPI0009194F6A|nr:MULTISPECIES: tripartite tricarboxylate transporter TctB family protein [Paracoccus]RDD72052.1 tripartite tricarboxylate transporter TctB family protein [Paracoccus versutus]WGR62044.1 tripartite tricarboxylate transporter TctB family protein [Paracoccus ferrooxidans]SFY36931.1 putative tricarboxylic transport membrane protein [Paracoccus pantotrophus]
MRHVLGIDRVVALICIAVAGLYLSASLGIAQGSFGDPLGPRAFPQILGALLILFSIITLVQPSARQAPATPLATLVAIAICAALVLGFILLLPVVGYAATSFLLFLGFLLTLREPLRLALLYAAGLTLLFYVVFTVLLQTYFPPTMLGRIF